MLKDKLFTNRLSIGFSYRLLQPTLFFGDWVPYYPATEFKQVFSNQETGQVLWAANLKNFTVAGKRFKAFENKNTYFTFEPSYTSSYIVIKDLDDYENFVNAFYVSLFEVN